MPLYCTSFTFRQIDRSTFEVAIKLYILTSVIISPRSIGKYKFAQCHHYGFTERKQDEVTAQDRSIGTGRSILRRTVETILMPDVKGDSPDASSSTCSPKYNAPGRVLANLFRDETSGTPSSPFLTTFEIITMCIFPRVWTPSASLSLSLSRLVFSLTKILSDSQTVNHIPFHLLTPYPIPLVLALNSCLCFSCSALLSVLDSPVSQYSEWD